MSQEKYEFGITDQEDFEKKVTAFLNSDNLYIDAKENLRELVDEEGIGYLFDLVDFFFKFTAQQINQGEDERKVLILFAQQHYELVLPLLELIDRGLDVNWNGLSNALIAYHVIVELLPNNPQLSTEAYKQVVAIF